MTKQEQGLKEYFKIVKKRILLICTLVCIATLTTGIVSYYFITPVYQASSKLIVTKKSDEAMNQLDLNSVNTNLSLINTYKEIIKTSSIIDKVVKEHPKFNLTSDQLMSKVKVSSVNSTQVMTVEVQDASYEKAARIVNAVSEVFKKEIPTIMNIDNVSILNRADIKDKPSPVKPNPNMNIAISFVVSLMVAVGIVFVLEYMDDSIKSEDDVEQYLGLPVLSAIPKVKEKDLNYSGTSKKIKVGGEQANVTINQ